MSQGQQEAQPVPPTVALDLHGFLTTHQFCYQGIKKKFPHRFEEVCVMV